MPRRKRPAKQANGQHEVVESTDGSDSVQGWDYFTMVNPKGLDGLVAKKKVSRRLVEDFLSELYDLSIRGESLHGGRRAIIRLLQQEGHPDLEEDRGYYLLSHLIDRPKRGGSKRP